MTERPLAQVGELVRRLFWRQKSAHASSKVESAPPPSSQPESSLVDFQLPPTPIVASRLQLIGLDRVRTLLGDRWSKLAERVRGIAQTIIEKNLLPGDVYEAHGDDGFLVLFPKLSEEEARFKSRAICRQIEERLIGCKLTDVSACTFEVFTVDAGSPILSHADETLARIDAHEIELANEEPRSHVSSPSPHSNSAAYQGGWAATLVPDRIVTGPATASPPEFRSEETETVAKPGKGVSVPVLREPTCNQWVYRPVWDFQRSTLLTFALIPFRLDTTPVARDDMPPGSVDEEFLAKLDNTALSKAVLDLETLSKSGRRLPILVQIHHATVVNARRRAFFVEKVKTVSTERRKLISLEIVECPSNGMTMGFSGFVAAMRGQGVRMAMRVDSDWRDFRGIERSGVSIATMDAADLIVSEAACIAAFETFADRTANAKLESAVWSLSTRSLVVGAASAGIRHLAGAAIAEEIATLTNALRFSPVDLYRQRP